MKTHYTQPGYDQIKCNSVHILHDFTVDDYRKVDCLKCIAAMSPGEQVWHDKNNSAWISHKAKDGRRKG